MAEQGPPVTINELIQLTNVGIQADQVTWSRVTLSSDKWMAVRHGKKKENSNKCMVTVLSPRNGNISYAGQTSADSVLMNPVDPIIALKADQRFEIFNVETKMMLTKTKIHDPVCYWTWLTSEIIAIVTDTAVYHWSLFKNKDSHPEKVFMRHSRLQFSEITSYKADENLRWLAITGLVPEEDKISGLTQLYNADEDITQCIACHAVCFDTYKFAGNSSVSTVFCVGSRDLQNHGKVHVIELGPYKTGNFALRNIYDSLQFFDDADHYDFPVALHVSGEFGLLFLLTKYGYLYLCDMETSSCLCCTRVSEEILFASTLNSETQGIIGITRNGQALDLKPHQIDWVMRHMGHSLDVHKIYYRSTSDIIERTQIAKILLLQDTGRLDEFANQSLEDIQLSELAEEAGGNPDDVPMEELFAASEDMNEDEDTEEDNTNLAESSETRPGQRAKKNSAVTRQKWSSDEEKEIGQIFEKYFNEKRRPTPKQCLKAMRISKKNDGVIHLRKKDVLKKKVYRMIDNLDK